MSETDGGQQELVWSPRKRAICSALILFHLIAIVAAPFSGPGPSSELGVFAGRLFEPYLRVIYMYHGYRFFAPEPGPSHLIEYVIQTKSGETVTGRFPDRSEQWPRLYYHRYFMLSTTLFELSVNLLPPAEEFERQKREIDAEIERLKEANQLGLAGQLQSEKQQLQAEYDLHLQQKEAICAAISNELLNRFDGKQIELFALQRNIPLPGEILDGLEQGKSTNELIRDESRIVIRQQIYSQEVIGAE